MDANQITMLLIILYGAWLIGSTKDDTPDKKL